ncbi:hypothetical protein [Geodermatophilus normandii]|uniref:Uncharacterized protein n=1 Tax=Geodermatophilus normandii TaxID=1137989 RepID=A0A6P0GHS2_9ACTN|nr:hypothetical protein [Geodermatophilus normandii]NEM06804.1 hypothetical protein [Geodermatophilus normandii]
MSEPVPTRDHALVEEGSGGEPGGGQSTGTVVVAGPADLGIAIAELVGGRHHHRGPE